MLNSNSKDLAARPPNEGPVDGSEKTIWARGTLKPQSAAISKALRAVRALSLMHI